MTTESLKHLLEPLKLGSVQLANRVSMAPLTRARAGTRSNPEQLDGSVLRSASVSGIDHHGSNRDFTSIDRVATIARYFHRRDGGGLAKSHTSRSRKTGTNLYAVVALRSGHRIATFTTGHRR